MAESSSRFIALDKPTEDYIQEQRNKNTRTKTRLANSLNRTWKEETRTVEEIKPDEPSKYLCKFILRVKRKHGEDYEPSSEGSFQVLTGF
jgi:hypothetical protein